MVTANLDEYGDLHELDMWKVDFSPLKQFPTMTVSRTAAQSRSIHVEHGHYHSEYHHLARVRIDGISEYAPYDESFSDQYSTFLQKAAQIEKGQ
ncbi:hypothetical protein CY652_22830 [Burkholderia sp. WAC0059]|nr:hypothetical protein CY652_22830 [Burkholderia sp. WAC0059]